MELYHLRAFIEVSRHRNLTRAADHLHLSPSALSSQIKSLEEEIGVALFIRSPKGMKLTGQGRDLLAHAISTIKAATRLRDHAKEMTGKPNGILKIGINTDPDFLKMSSLTEALSENLPDVSIRYIGSSTLDTARMLRKQIIQIGFVYGDHLAKDVEIRPLTKVDINVVIPSTMFEAPPVLDWKDISRLPWIWGEERCPPHHMFKELLHQHGAVINKASYAVDEEITKQLVKDGKGVALVRSDEARELENAGQAYIWGPGTVQVPFGLACLVERKNDPLIHSAADAIARIWMPLNR